ncbi:MAG: hypothetical protein ACJ8ER_16725 [Allosphingosinicella sp.]
MDDQAKAGSELLDNGPKRAANSAQTNLLRTAKSPKALGKTDKRAAYRTRDWSLYFFFRIMRRAEMEKTRQRLREAMPDPAPASAASGSSPGSGQDSSLLTLKFDLAYPSLVNPGLVRQAVADPVAGHPPADDAADAFLNWLKVLVDGDGEPLRQEASDLSAFFLEEKPSVVPEAAGGEAAASAAGDMSATAMAEASAISKLVTESFHKGDVDSALSLARDPAAFVEYLRANYAQLLESLRDKLHEPADELVPGPLVHVVLYELLRQHAPAFAGRDGNGNLLIAPAIRSESAEDLRKVRDEICDQTPVSLAFTYSGLRALKVDRDTLASFPDAFKEGMAARARRLGDIGPSAPENWEGELGLAFVHGYFSTGSNLEVDKPEKPLKESFWKRLRSEVRAFNDPVDKEASELRLWIGLLFRIIGLEILHIELGQDPYDLREETDKKEKEEIEEITPRVEHFGFRDGLSQPFVDMKLGQTLPGGGTASRRGSWTPVAPGEIFLDQEDESGQVHQFPANPALREGATFLVFRKLEQDVAGFRAFIGRQRPRDEWAQRTLEAQFVGRWPNGTPLSQSPQTERAVTRDAEPSLNDFRYGDDPMGLKCPLGAHIRRANPRDIGGRNDVRHHRILRRGISYGGPLLHHKTPDDGEKRGLLFIAANARIDLQFEVVQADWINGGEFLGQAGLGRCPLTGANDGSLTATFLESGAAAPVRGLPSFVTMRGGDYFFAPGTKALQDIAARKTFPAEESELCLKGYSMGEAATSDLFGLDRLTEYSKRMFTAKPEERVVRVQARPPEAASTTMTDPEKIAFVARYEDVTRVLSNDVTADAVDFSVWPYRDAGRRITRGEDFLIATDAAGSPSRQRLLEILDHGWKALETLLGRDPMDVVGEVARTQLDRALRTTSRARRIDLIDDLATPAAYAVVDKVFGMPGPRWVTEIAAAIPFARQHVGDVPPDWFARVTGEKPSDPGLTTMQVWTTMLVADLIANVQVQQPLQVLAKQAGAEMLSHLDIKLAEAAQASRSGAPAPNTLVTAFLAKLKDTDSLARYYPGEPDPRTLMSLYLKDVALILLEILGSLLAVVPFTFASVMKALLDRRIDLALLAPRLSTEGIRRLIYEAERLNPNVQVRMRRCERDTSFGNQTICKRDIVAAIIGAANMDGKTFKDPERLSLDNCDPFSSSAPARDLEKYLLFGVEGSQKICWGRRRVAMPVLEECIKATGRLQGLRRVAGPGGEPVTLAGVTVGLPARFTRTL